MPCTFIVERSCDTWLLIPSYFARDFPESQIDFLGFFIYLRLLGVGIDWFCALRTQCYPSQIPSIFCYNLLRKFLPKLLLRPELELLSGIVAAAEFPAEAPAEAAAGAAIYAATNC